jgi:energy-coupling factor transporter ATP-binding protein EcfA2
LHAERRIYFVTGASGAGKSAVLETLERLLPDHELHDFDEWGVPEGADLRWRQETTERWLVRAEHASQDLVVSGGAVYGEVLACPAATRLDRIACCLLDCDDTIRLARIRERGTPALATMDMLAWSAWLRVHAADPTWWPDVIRRGAWPAMQWSRWSDWEAADPRWRCPRIDTTHGDVARTARNVAQWIRLESAPHAAGRNP